MRIEQERGGLTHLLDVRISEAQRAWLVEAGKREQPSLDASRMLARLLERAMSDSENEQDRRDHQLEVYRASGYAEHHPDYPNLPKRPADG
jgi:hypothetical protein